MLNKNNYHAMREGYGSKCPEGQHYHPEHPKADKKGCMKDSDMKEKFGSFSLSAAVRPPYASHQEAKCPCTYSGYYGKEPCIPGVS